jgi:hypothetical protein
MRIIGIDAAVSARHVGVAVATWDGTRCLLESAFRVAARGTMSQELPQRLEPWLRPGSQGLMAIDAPLGWPRSMRPLLESVAGQSLEPLARGEDRFLRFTDQMVRYSTGKVPLSVGADRIARTAQESLITLGLLRTQTGFPLPLAWPGEPRADWSVIEVYPGATLAAHTGLARRPRIDVRRGEADAEGIRANLEFLDAHLDGTEVARQAIAASDHVLDACLTVVAAQDFLRGEVLPPRGNEMDIAREEGWIWFHAPFFCRSCSLPLLEGWRGDPIGFGRGETTNRPELPELPRIERETCAVCGGRDRLPMDHVVFRNVHTGLQTGLPSHWVMYECAPPSERHVWLRSKGIPLPYSSASRFSVPAPAPDPPRRRDLFSD